MIYFISLDFRRLHILVLCLYSQFCFHLNILVLCPLLAVVFLFWTICKWMFDKYTCIPLLPKQNLMLGYSACNYLNRGKIMKVWCLDLTLLLMIDPGLIVQLWFFSLGQIIGISFINDIFVKRALRRFENAVHVSVQCSEILCWWQNGRCFNVCPIESLPLHPVPSFDSSACLNLRQITVESESI